MKLVTLRFRPKNRDYDEVIMVSRIIRLSKCEQGWTVIHFEGGEIETEDSINTLEARLNSEEQS